MEGFPGSRLNEPDLKLYSVKCIIQSVGFWENVFPVGSYSKPLNYICDVLALHYERLGLQLFKIELALEGKLISTCGVAVTTLAFQAGKPGFNPWSDLY